MRVIRFAWVLPVLVIGCGGGRRRSTSCRCGTRCGPSPAVVASLDAVGARCGWPRASRPRARPMAPTDAVAGRPTVAAAVGALDDARARRSADALVVGEVARRCRAARRGRRRSAGDQARCRPSKGGGDRARRRWRRARWRAPRRVSCAASSRPRARGAWSGSSAGPSAPSQSGRRSTSTPLGWWRWRRPSAGADGGATRCGRGAVGRSGQPPRPRQAGARASASGIADGGAPLARGRGQRVVRCGTVVSCHLAHPPAATATADGPSFWDACSASADSCDTGSDGSDACEQRRRYDGRQLVQRQHRRRLRRRLQRAPRRRLPVVGSAPGRERPRDVDIVWVLAPLGFLIGRRR